MSKKVKVCECVDRCPVYLGVDASANPSKPPKAKKLYICTHTLVVPQLVIHSLLWSFSLQFITLKGSSHESKHLVKGGRKLSLIDLHFPGSDYYFLKTRKRKKTRGQSMSTCQEKVAVMMIFKRSFCHFFFLKDFQLPSPKFKFTCHEEVS
jgi:hypothetical protein